MHSVGIVGAGKIARVHGANAAGLDRLRIAAVADVEPAFARDLAGSSAATSPRALTSCSRATIVLS